MSQSRVREYLESLVRYNSDICETIRERALEDEVPIIRRDTESFLKTVLAMKRPKTILEVGQNLARHKLQRLRNMKSAFLSQNLTFWQQGKKNKFIS